MNVAARILLGFAIVLPACEVAEASGSTNEVAMTDGGESRVLGKRAFDAAAAGYPAFVRLSNEAPQRTLDRATDRLDLLESELGRIRVHTHVDALAVELVEAENLVRAARDAISSTKHRTPVADAHVDSVVALVGEAQRVLDGVRERRLHAPS